MTENCSSENIPNFLERLVEVAHLLINEIKQKQEKIENISNEGRGGTSAVRQRGCSANDADLDSSNNQKTALKRPRPKYKKNMSVFVNIPREMVDSIVDHTEADQFRACGFMSKRLRRAFNGKLEKCQVPLSLTMGSRTFEGNISAILRNEDIAKSITRIRLLYSNESHPTWQFERFQEMLNKCGNVKMLDLTSFNFYGDFAIRTDLELRRAFGFLSCIADYSNDHKTFTELRMTEKHRSYIESTGYYLGNYLRKGPLREDYNKVLKLLSTAVVNIV